MSFLENLFAALTQFPTWLESFDSLNIPAWAVLLVFAFAVVGLIFALREFLSWFLKTSAIVDEVVRLENMVRDLQGDLATLESVVEKLQVTSGSAAGPAHAPPHPVTHHPVPQFDGPVKLDGPVKPQFRLDN